MGIYNGLFDRDNDGRLDSGELAQFMDFEDYMNHSGIYEEKSHDVFSGFDDFDSDFGDDDF